MENIATTALMVLGKLLSPQKEKRRRGNKRNDEEEEEENYNALLNSLLSIRKTTRIRDVCNVQLKLNPENSTLLTMHD